MESDQDLVLPDAWDRRCILKLKAVKAIIRSRNLPLLCGSRSHVVLDFTITRYIVIVVD